MHEMTILKRNYVGCDIYIYIGPSKFRVLKYLLILLQDTTLEESDWVSILDDSKQSEVLRTAKGKTCVNKTLSTFLKRLKALIIQNTPIVALRIIIEVQ